jgi:hypothetical protein
LELKLCLFPKSEMHSSLHRQRLRGGGGFEEGVEEEEEEKRGGRKREGGKG